MKRMDSISLFCLLLVLLSERFTEYGPRRLRDDDLSYLMSMNTKDLHKVCGKLREERFITMFENSLHSSRDRG